jgi:hypothetical protein
MKRGVLTVGVFWALCTLAGAACGKDPGAPVDAPRPQVYALIAAVGEDFTFVHEVQTTGSHLSPYRRTTSPVANNLLNKLALNGLDAAVAKAQPDSKRIYASFSAPPMNGIAPSERGEFAVARVLTEIEKLPQRTEWDRILIVVPAYRALDLDRMASKLQGFGIFSQPLCQAGCPTRDPRDLRFMDNEPMDGVAAVNSKDEAIRVRTFIAPFSYIEVFVVDPKTMAVIDRQPGFDNQKLGERKSDPPLDPDKTETQNYLFSRIASLIEFSVGEAVRRSDVNRKRPVVEVGDIKEVAPDGPDK